MTFQAQVLFDFTGSLAGELSVKAGDTIAVTKNMVYDFDQADTPTVPTLADFKIRLARQMIRSAFFQDVKKEDFDMLR